MILHWVANYMDMYQGDLFIDFPNMWEEYSTTGKTILFVGKTHTDLPSRISWEVDLDRKIKEYQRTLGMDLLMIISPEKVIVEYRKQNTTTKDFNWFAYRLENDFGCYGLGEVEILDKRTIE
jgi:hypothetical protein